MMKALFIRCSLKQRDELLERGIDVEEWEWPSGVEYRVDVDSSKIEDILEVLNLDESDVESFDYLILY